MGKNEDNLLQTIIERLSNIERKQALHSLDGVVLLAMPISLFILGLVINFGLAGIDPLVLLIPVSLLQVLFFPIALYLMGIWRDVLSLRLNALLFFLHYLILFIFTIPIYFIYKLLFPYKLQLIVYSTLLIFLGGAVPSFLLSRLIAFKYIIPAYGRAGLSLGVTNLARVYLSAFFPIAKKISIPLLILLFLGYTLPFIL